MLQLNIESRDVFNETSQEIISIKEQTLVLEHSLLSISKWESKWHIPFLGQDEKTTEQTLDYIKCMTINQNVDPLIYYCLKNEEIQMINDYIKDPMTATWFNEEGYTSSKSNNEIITSELIYYWMIALQIPVEFQKWHLNRLLTLIKVCNIKNSPPKKMSRNEILNRNRTLNQARRAKYGSKG